MLAEAASRAWAAAHPELSVVVATRDRAGFLPALLAALAAQRDAGLEVTLADDGSSDGTWETLRELVAETTLPVLALRLAGSHGPSLARNSAACRARGRWLAFTDDDCLPAPRWATSLLAALRGGAALVQGTTLPDPRGRRGVWDRSIRVTGPTLLGETCNLAVSRARFADVGGFPVLDLLPTAGRGFGEDVAFAAAVLPAGVRPAFAAGALVHHRWIPGTYADHLAGVRRLAGFGPLTRAVPALRAAYWHRVFLSRRSAAFDAALAGALLAAGGRRPAAALAGGLLALPWLRATLPVARDKPGRALPVRLAQLGYADLVGLLALARGSLRARRLLL